MADTKNFKKTIFCIAMGVGVSGLSRAGISVVVDLVPGRVRAGEDGILGEP